jgi:preprotein translocase subunit YajC
LILSIAAIQAAPGSGTSLMPMLFMWGSIILIFWFLIFRPQRQAQKRHQAMLAALKRGDEVMTDGGIIGQVVHIQEDRVTLRTGETKIIVARPKIARIFVPGEETGGRS